MAYNTNVVLENTADGYVAEGKSIKGGYFVIDALANIPAVLNVKGAKCYNQADDKVYTYNGSSWVVDTSLTNPMSLAGDMIIGGIGGVPRRLAANVHDRAFLVSLEDGGTPLWITQANYGTFTRYDDTTNKVIYLPGSWLQLGSYVTAQRLTFVIKVGNDIYSPMIIFAPFSAISQDSSTPTRLTAETWQGTYEIRMDIWKYQGENTFGIKLFMNGQALDMTDVTIYWCADIMNY